MIILNKHGSNYTMSHPNPNPNPTPNPNPNPNPEVGRVRGLLYSYAVTGDKTFMK